MGVVQGRLLVGLFDKVEQVKRGDGTAVANLYEISVRQDGREWPLRASYFATDEEGDPTRVQRQLEEAKPQPGQLVAVRFTSKATAKQVEGSTKAYQRDTAVALYVLDEYSAPRTNGEKAEAKAPAKS